MEKVRFTVERVAAIKPPAMGELLIADADVPSLLLRVRATGAKSWIVRYRPGGGRGAQTRKLSIGDAFKIGVADARSAAKAHIGAVAQGRDPMAEKQAKVRSEAARLDRAIAAYVESLHKRQLVKAKDIGTLLNRELIGQFGAKRDVSTLTRRDLVELFDLVEKSGRPGTAADLKTRASTFLNWAVGQDLVSANVLGGLRRPRATRSETLKEGTAKGRALSEAEIRMLWVALDAIKRPYFACYVRFLLLTGCRRTEAAALRRSWFCEVEGRQYCEIPAAHTKSGRNHIVGLPPILARLLGELPKSAKDPDLIFCGRGGKQMRGWSPLMKVLRAELAAKGFKGVLRLHDLRKTARTWWSVLGADEGLAEFMISHRAKDALVRLYDENERLPERFALTQRWCEKVAAMVV